MRYMNGYDIDSAAVRYALHPILSDAVRTLRDLKAWTDSNSDGWAYWPKPARAAAKLMELIDGNGTYEDYVRIRDNTTLADLTKALRPIKTFRTKMCGPSATVANNAGVRGPMPWFPITAQERAERDAARQAEADSARAESITRLANKFAPAIDDYAFRIRNGAGISVPGSRTMDVARELAELAVDGW